MYYSHTPVLHLNDVAGTAHNLVATARLEGRNWAMRTLPAAPSLLSGKAWWQRAKDAFDYATRTKRPDLLHVHYAPNGYYAWITRTPYVLHLHGTDLRVDLHRPGVGYLTRQAILGANRVVVATPDLLSAAQKIRSDAVYIPNTLPRASLINEAQPHIPGRVVFNARWDDSKGGRALTESAAALTKAGIEVVGIDWGAYAIDARNAGVRMLPTLSSHAYKELLSSAQVVVGQFNIGSLGISDLQTLAVGRPLVTFVNQASELDVPLINVSAGQIAQAVHDLLDDPAQADVLGESGRIWVRRNRHPREAVNKLEKIYKEVLG